MVVIGVAVLAVVLGTVLAVVLTQRQPQAAPTPTPTPSATEVAYPPNATDDRDGIVLNDNAGKPEVGLYFDYQCAHCVAFEKSFAGALSLLGQTGEIRFVHHPRVFLDRGDPQGLSHRAAHAAACADVVGAYQGYHEAIFAAAPQGPYTEQLFTETIPERLGITGADLTAFRACYANQNLAQFVQGVDDAAAAAGIDSTPTLTVNGKVVPAREFQGKTGADLKAIIDAAARNR